MSQDQLIKEESQKVLNEIKDILKKNHYDIAIRNEIVPIPNGNGVLGFKNSFQLIKTEDDTRPE